MTLKCPAEKAILRTAYLQHRFPGLKRPLADPEDPNSPRLDTSKLWLEHAAGGRVVWKAGSGV